ncbi:MAG: SDR family oxidoreductase [Methylococcaceae bacterium]|nr:SDR family oxidoreductase [Methylococcaceae bacterium]
MKTILITGSNSDIGIAVTKALAKPATLLALHYYSNSRKAEGLKDWLDQQTIKHRLFQCDLTQPASAELLIRETVKAFGRIDVLVNVVGPFVYKNILDVTPTEWQQDVDTNLNTCFFTSHYALDALRESRGQIINFAFSGVENIKAWPMSTGYCAAKTGVAALTKSLATALAPFKVRVNAICPGLVEEGHITAEERQQMAAQIPYGRPVHPDEIGKTVNWLVNDSPETMTGSFITVSGGWEY